MELYKKLLIECNLIEIYGKIFIIKPYLQDIYDNINQLIHDENKFLGIKYIGISKFQKEFETFELFIKMFEKMIKSEKDLPLKFAIFNNFEKNNDYDYDDKEILPFFHNNSELKDKSYLLYAQISECEADLIKFVDFYKNLIEKIFLIPVFKLLSVYHEKILFYEIKLVTYLNKFDECVTLMSFKFYDNKMMKHYQIKHNYLENPYVFTFETYNHIIGTLIAIHQDNDGLILPPILAPMQIAVLIPSIKESKLEYKDFSENILKMIKDNDLTGFIDDRPFITYEEKYNLAVKQGIPLIIKISEFEIENECVTIIRRDLLDKYILKTEEMIKKINEVIKEIKEIMFFRAKYALNSNIIRAESCDEILENPGKLYIVRWCKSHSCYVTAKDKIGLELLGTVIGTDNTQIIDCFNCKKMSLCDAVWHKLQIFL